VEFQTHKIGRKRKTPLKLPKIPKKKAAWGLAILLILYYLIKFLTSEAGITDFIFSLGEPLQTDEKGNTNFLLMGTGGGAHEGADLTDSIIAVSLNHKNNAVTLLSIPRDFYVDTKMGDQDRINKVYTTAKYKFQDSKAGLQLMKEIVTDTLETEIHYYIKLNFSGFADVIDQVGGIDLYVDETIDDPFYPKDETIKFEPFYLSKGKHHLDGETALKYVRSRKTTSDFDRSHRQQKLMLALKDKVIKDGIISDPDQIKDIFYNLKDDIETDLSIREMIKLAGVAKEINGNGIISYILHDDPSRCGGFLYTPQRDLYGGAFVLVPASDPFDPNDNFDYIGFFIHEVYKNPAVAKENIEIQILNGTESPGLAGITKSLLSRSCFNVYRYGNAKDLDHSSTKIYAKTEKALNSETIKIIQNYLGTGEITANIPQHYLEHPYESDAEIMLELGEDYAANPHKDPFDFLIDMLPSTIGENGEETEEAVTTEEE
jgi:polyisoprenyl-teichoic acid--peptidoglycan teichoic acid transferase